MAETTQTANLNSPAFPARECGDCMLCCKLFELEQLSKPRGKWCQHAVSGKGCGIYPERPVACQTFACGWLMDRTLGPQWKPNKAKFVIQLMLEGNVQILVDPASPGAWKADAYYPHLKMMAARLFDMGKFVIVNIGQKGFVMLPQKDVAMPELPSGGTFRIEQVLIDGKPDYRVVAQH